MDHENQMLDAELSTSKERTKEESLLKQLRVFWIILIILQGINLLPVINGESPSIFQIIIGLVPIFFYYTIVIQKNPRFITWGLLYLVITGLLSFAALCFTIYGLIISGNYNWLNLLLLSLIIVIFSYQIWGIVLHGKYKNDE